MSLFDRFLRLLGFRNMVLIDGKGFTNLTLPEAAEMIEVHLGKPGRFAPEAVSEFYTVPNAGALEQVRQRLLTIQSEFADSDEPDGLSTERGRVALEALAGELRGDAVPEA